MPYGTLALDAISTSGNLAVTGNVSALGNLTVTGTIASSAGTTYPLVSATAQTASGTSVDFTGVPSWVRRITMTVTGLSYAAAGSAQVRIGSGSLVASGYTTWIATINNATASAVTSLTTGIAGYTTSAAAGTVSGMTTLVLQDSATNTWVATATTQRPSDTQLQHYIGYIALSGTLDRISLVASTSSFDAGTVNILYE